MADWNKKETPVGEESGDAVQPQTTPTSDIAEQTDKQARKAQKRAARAEQKRRELIAFGKKMREKEAEKKARFSKNGRRRGRFAFAAPLGLIMSLLAIVGVVALIFGAVDLVNAFFDDTALREEAYYFLQPLMAYNPIPDFDDVNAEDLDELLQAAVWRITEAERIRMLREKDDNTVYELDSNGRLVVPVDEIVDSYQYLFGSGAVLHHRSLEDSDLEYSEQNACYYVPFNFINSLHQPVIDTIRRQGGNYHVKVAYVSINDLKVDEHGNTIDPTPDMAAFSQIYVLKRENTHFIVTAVGQEAEK